MANPYNLHGSRIDWTLISEEDFNRAVEALLVRAHTDEHQVARVLDGKGGDGGIDVAIWRRSDNKVLHIFQLKYFPEGFTGGYREARRPQVKKSFDTAWENHEPASWTLVMPKNPHKNELQFVLDLPANKEVEVDILGIAQLDELLAQHPDIEAAILNNGLVEILKQMGSENAALTGSQDLQERVEGLHTVASNRSLYWDTSFQMTPLGYEEWYTPKHPDAMKHEPIQTQFTLSLGAEHDDLLQRLQKTLDYGSFEEITFPPGTGKLERTGPPWVAPIRDNNDSTFSFRAPVSVPNKKEILTLHLRDQWGCSQGRFEGVVKGRTWGARGVSVHVPLNNCLNAVLRLESLGTDQTQGQHDLKPKGHLDLQLNIDGALVDDALQGITTLNSFVPGVLFELYFNGNKAGVMQVDGDSGPRFSDEYLLDLLEDLAFIKRKTGLSFVVPEELSPHERVMIRVAKILLEGKGTHLPEGSEFTMIHNGENLERFEDLLSTGGPVIFTQPKFPFDFQDSRIDLGQVTVYSRRVTADDNEEIRAAITNGDIAGRKLRLKTVAPETWWVYPTDAPRDDNGEPIFSDWGLPGIDEDKNKPQS